MGAFDEFYSEDRWVAWRNEQRGNKVTKVPYSPRTGSGAKANDPSTWGTRAEAEALAQRIVNGSGGGTGMMLGNLGNGYVLVGIDLDTCRDEDGNLAEWARAVVDRIDSYTEISPSQTGVKIFLLICIEHMLVLQAALGDAKFSRMFTRHGAGKDHPPAIEVHLGNRYFAVTEWHLEWTPTEPVEVDVAHLLWLLTEYGPEFSGNSAADPSGPPDTGVPPEPDARDNSRSAIAFRVGREARRDGASFEEMCEALRADPSTAKWFLEKGDKRQLQRIWEKAEAVARSDLPVVQLANGKLPENINETEQLLIEHDHEVFQRGDMVVRPAREMIDVADARQAIGMRLVPIRTVHLVDRLTRIIDFRRYDFKSKDLVRVNCPMDLAAAYLERVGEWRLPVLRGIIDAPTLRPDGSVVDQPGYDRVTGILYAPSEKYLAVPVRPSKDAARAALDVLCGLIRLFPFVDQNDNVELDRPTSSRSVALSLILTTLIRRSLENAPLHAFDAPVMGSGKSKLVDIASMIATGHEAPVIAQGQSEEEMEKRLGAALIAGDVLISLDNCEHPLVGELLCQALTQQMLKIRILGKSVQVMLPTNCTFAATGNNLVVSGDMVRRTIVATLDPKVERPELRRFSSDPVKVVRFDRPQYVLAALTVLRAYFVADLPSQGLAPLGSFEDWSAKVRNSLVWLGEADPCVSMDTARSQDPQTMALAAVLSSWHESISSREVTVKRAVEIAIEANSGDFRDAVAAVSGERDVINARLFGKWLSKNKGKVVNGLRIEQGLIEAHGGVARWKVVKAQ